MSAVRGLDRVARDRRAIIAAQVRCSTGFTQGIASDDGARHAVLAPMARRAAVVDEADPPEGVAKTMRHPHLARWLKAPT